MVDKYFQDKEASQHSIIWLLVGSSRPAVHIYGGPDAKIFLHEQATKTFQLVIVISTRLIEVSIKLTNQICSQRLFVYLKGKLCDNMKFQCFGHLMCNITHIQCQCSHRLQQGELSGPCSPSLPRCLKGELSTPQLVNQS